MWATIFDNRAMRFLTQWRVLLALAVLMLLFFPLFSWLQQRLGIEILDVLPRYDVGEYIGHMVVYSDNQAIGLYRRSIFTLDLAFPIIYLLLYVGLILRLADKEWMKLLIILPLIVFTLDLLENARIFMLLQEWPRISPQLVASASQATELKWYFSYAMLVVIGLLALWRGIPWLINRLTGR